jgi:hypothetical protein
MKPQLRAISASRAENPQRLGLVGGAEWIRTAGSACSSESAASCPSTFSVSAGQRRRRKGNWQRTRDFDKEPAGPVVRIHSAPPRSLSFEAFSGMIAKNARVGAMHPPHRYRRELTCRVMPRNFDFLSVGEEFGADALGEYTCTVENLRTSRAVRGAPLSSNF